MRHIYLTGFLITVLLLPGCSRQPADVISYIPPSSSSGQLCAVRCNETHDYCRQGCVLENRDCLNKVQGQALIDYENYMSQQFLHANAIEHTVHDFENVTPCEDQFRICAAICETPYKSCFTQCGGRVETSRSCGLLCF